MVINAPYQRSKLTIERYAFLKIPLIYVDHYQSQMTPVELVFSYIKDNDLNPLNPLKLLAHKFHKLIFRS